MLGKNTTYLSIIIFSLYTLHLPAFAMTVSDPTSYTYYAQQLAKMQKQIQQAQSMIAKAEEANSFLGKIESELKGSYYRGQYLLNKMKMIQNKYSDTPSGIMKQAKGWMQMMDSAKDFAEVGSLLDDTFGDPRSKDFNAWKVMDQKYQTRQSVFKDTIEESESILNEMPDDLKEIEELMKEVDKTENLKDAQDMTNALLGKILLVLHRQLAFSAKVATAQNVLNYNGANEDIMKERIEAAKNAESESQKAINNYYEKLDSGGIDRDSKSVESIKALYQ